jgi:hypothetical protein
MAFPNKNKNTQEEKEVAVNNLPKMKAPGRDWQEIEVGAPLNFSAPNSNLLAIYRGLVESKKYPGRVLALLTLEDASTVLYWCPMQLETMLRVVPVGHMVSIYFRGEVSQQKHFQLFSKEA